MQAKTFSFFTVAVDCNKQKIAIKLASDAASANTRYKQAISEHKNATKMRCSHISSTSVAFLQLDSEYSDAVAKSIAAYCINEHTALFCATSIASELMYANKNSKYAYEQYKYAIDKLNKVVRDNYVVATTYTQAINNDIMSYILANAKIGASISTILNNFYIATKQQSDVTVQQSVVTVQQSDVTVQQSDVNDVVATTTTTTRKRNKRKQA